MRPEKSEKPEKGAGPSELWYAGGVIGVFLMLLAVALMIATRCAR